MASTAKAQRAKHRAFKRFVETDPETWENLLKEEYEKDGLTYKRRLTPQERKERDDAEKKAKVEEQIRKLSEENGIPVVIGKTEAEIEREVALDVRSEAEEQARDAADQP
jgi:isopentenyl diphosphate isomerase/L-lactate dehydrogenase-like FMN-dependent dehydrogenase